MFYLPKQVKMKTKHYFFILLLLIFSNNIQVLAQKIVPVAITKDDRDGDGVPDIGGRDKCPTTNVKIEGRLVKVQINGEEKEVRLPKRLDNKYIKNEKNPLLAQQIELKNQRGRKLRELRKWDNKDTKGKEEKQKKKAMIVQTESEIAKLDTLIMEMGKEIRNVDPDSYILFQATVDGKKQEIKVYLRVDAFGCLTDSDRDGSPDMVDRCPDEMGSVESDGCPDRDEDGTPDKDDDCPDIKGPRETKGCPDRDGDGIIDTKDDCPDTKGLVELNGCPDRDGDGIPDKDDDCPNTKGLKQFKGCPDTDGDGIMDKEDDCPTVKGVVQFKGCPDTDNDGVQDQEDDCPEVPGTIDNKGCPEILEKASRVLFKSGSAIILEQSYSLLDELVDLLKEYDNSYIALAGHTDSQGDDATNLALSKNRAKAVKDYLVKKGIAENRISHTGFGEAKPIADNTTNAGRAKNRRVEMKLSNKPKE